MVYRIEVDPCNPEDSSQCIRTADTVRGLVYMTSSFVELRNRIHPRDTAEQVGFLASFIPSIILAAESNPEWAERVVSDYTHGNTEPDLRDALMANAQSLWENIPMTIEQFDAENPQIELSPEVTGQAPRFHADGTPCNCGDALRDIFGALMGIDIPGVSEPEPVSATYATPGADQTDALEEGLTGSFYPVAPPAEKAEASGWE